MDTDLGEKLINNDNDNENTIVEDEDNVNNNNNNNNNETKSTTTSPCKPTIKHLVISGGAHAGYNYIGILMHLKKCGFWNLSNIETIYATSIGALLGTIICLDFDDDIIIKYIIERPWNSVFKLAPIKILEAYTNKGFYGEELIQKILSPLLKAKSLSLDVTLEQFYNFSKIDIHIFTFELDSLKSVDLSYTTHPSLTLMKAITMSCALAGLFTPVFMDEKCYVDGGVLDNYPIFKCINGGTPEFPRNLDEILGIKCIFDTGSVKENDSRTSPIFTPEMTLLEFVGAVITNIRTHCRPNIKSNILHEIDWIGEEEIASLFDLHSVVNTPEARKRRFDAGIEYAKRWILSFI